VCADLQRVATLIIKKAHEGGTGAVQLKGLSVFPQLNHYWTSTEEKNVLNLCAIEIARSEIDKNNLERSHFRARSKEERLATTVAHREKHIAEGRAIQEDFEELYRDKAIPTPVAFQYRLFSNGNPHLVKP
jgi:hypothetical protein